MCFWKQPMKSRNKLLIVWTKSCCDGTRLTLKLGIWTEKNVTLIVATTFTPADTRHNISALITVNKNFTRVTTVRQPTTDDGPQTLDIPYSSYLQLDIRIKLILEDIIGNYNFNKLNVIMSQFFQINKSKQLVWEK